MLLTLMIPMPRSSMKVSDDVGRRTVELVGDVLNNHAVVGNQAVSALDELHGGFALSHAAFPCEQHSHAEDLHQHAVLRHRGREHSVEIDI